MTRQKSGMSYDRSCDACDTQFGYLLRARNRGDTVWVSYVSQTKPQWRE
jgi:hypothetical protein